MTLRNLCGAVFVFSAAVVHAQQPAMAPPPGYFTPPRVYTQPNPYVHPAGYVQQQVQQPVQQPVPLQAPPLQGMPLQPMPLQTMPQSTGVNAAAANTAPTLAATPNTNGVFDPFATSKTVHTPGSNMFNQPGNFVTGWKFPVWNRLKNKMGY